MTATTTAQPDELDSADIGARAARHLDRVFRELAHGPRSVQNEHFMRLLTGEPHPMGNIAIVADRNDADITEAALRPLVAADVPAAAIYVDGVDAAVEREIVAMGFHPESMPAMAVEIERLAETALPAGYAFERVGAADSKGWTEALRCAHRLGYRIGILQSSDMGHPIYLRLGFADKLRMPMFVRIPE
jgi:hypothetical protein